MDDSLLMRRLQALDRLDRDIEGVLEFQRTGFDLGVETFAFEEGHRDESLALDLVDRVDVTNIGVVQRDGGFGFALESLANVLVGHEVGHQELQSDGAVELGVIGFVDDAHAAFTEFFGDFVVRNRAADHAGPILP